MYTVQLALAAYSANTTVRLLTGPSPYRHGPRIPAGPLGIVLGQAAEETRSDSLPLPKQTAGPTSRTPGERSKLHQQRFATAARDPLDLLRPVTVPHTPCANGAFLLRGWRDVSGIYQLGFAWLKQLITRILRYGLAAEQAVTIAVAALRPGPLGTRSGGPKMKTARNYMVIAIIAAAALTGCGASTSAPAPKTAVATTQAAGGFALPDYKGKRLDIAIEDLKKAGITYDAEAVNGKAVLRAKNWTIASQAPAAGANVQAGEKVTFHVHKPEEASASAAPSKTTAAPTPTSPPTPALTAKEASNHWWYDAGGNRINSTISVLNQYVAATQAGDFGEAQSRCSQLQEYVALSSPQKLEALPDLDPVVGNDLVQAFKDGKEGTLVAARECSKFFEKNDQGALSSSRQFAHAAAIELDKLQAGLLGLQGLRR